MTQRKIKSKSTTLATQWTIYVGSLLIHFSAIYFITQNWDDWSNSSKSLAFLIGSSLIALATLLASRMGFVSSVLGSLFGIVASLGFLGCIAVLDVGGEYSLLSLSVGLLIAIGFFLVFRNAVSQYAVLTYTIVLGISAIQLIMDDSRSSSVWQALFLTLLGLIWIFVSSNYERGRTAGFIFGGALALMASQLTYKADTKFFTFLILAIFALGTGIELRKSKSWLHFIGFTLAISTLIGQMVATFLGGDNAMAAGLLGAGVAALSTSVIYRNSVFTTKTK